MKVNGSMIRLMEKVHIHTQMALIIMVIGSTISNMVSEWNLGQMAQSTKENTLMEKKKVKASLPLLMAATTKENLNKTRYAVTENISGQTVSNTKASGVKIKCTVRAH